MENKEVDLNEMLNTDSVTETGTEENEPIMNIETAQPETENTEQVQDWVSLDSCVTENKEKIENASIIDVQKIGIGQGKYFLFKTKKENDADLVLFDKPSTLWINDKNVSQIKVKNSGLIIKTDTSRIYAGKNNVVKVMVNQDDHITKMTTISRSKKKDDVKEEVENVETQDTDIDTTKLYIKKISPRLYSKVKDMTDKSEIKKSIYSYMDSVSDINHLIKLEKELLYTCKF